MLVLARMRIAMRMLHYLATCPGGTAQQAKIAKAISVPKPYTGKVARELLAAGYIKSVRGYHGGYALALPAFAIRVGDVVKLIDGTRNWRAGPDADEVCLGGALEDAQAKFFDVLNAHSIADLARQTSHRIGGPGAHGRSTFRKGPNGAMPDCLLHGPSTNDPGPKERSDFV